jgi:putative addiction module component (TIGR02574 family)
MMPPRRSNRIKELIEEANSLPVEERAAVADSILRSLDPPESEVDRKWAQVAQRRLAELRSGKVKPVPGEEVFARVWKRFEA